MTNSSSGFSEAFLAQLGVQTWGEKPSFSFARDIKAPEKPKLQVVEPVEVLSPLLDEVVVLEDSVELSTVPVDSNRVPFIVIGEDLSAFWQNEASLEWQLWLNIAETFDWEVEHIPFYDTLHLVSEDAIYATLEEVMELEVDWVLSMHTDSLFAEHLQEGLRLVSIPSLSVMLNDPYAKKDFFERISLLVCS